MVSKFDFFGLARLAFNPLAFAEMLRFHIDLGGGDAPKPDPAMTEIAKTQAKTGEELVGIGREQLAFSKERAAKYDPLLLGQMKYQTEAAQKAAIRGDEEWQRYGSLYRPVEDKMVSDAMSWDRPEELERESQRAGAEATRVFGATRDASRREMSRMGVDPSSGRHAGNELRYGLAEAAGRAGAENMARENRIMQAQNMRGNAVNVGRGMPATSLAQTSVGLEGSSRAAGTAGASAMLPAQLTSTALPWYGSGSSTAQGAAGIYSNQYGTQMTGFGIEEARSARQAENMGDFIGSIIGLGASFSDENMKEDKEPVNEELILEGLEKLPVESWKYKNGVADSGRHIGPYAQDVREQFGEGAAPGGQMIDLVSMNGLALTAIQALAKKVKKLEKSSGGLDMARAKRDTEPRRVA